MVQLTSIIGFIDNFNIYLQVINVFSDVWTSNREAISSALIVWYINDVSSPFWSGWIDLKSQNNQKY